MHNEIVQWEMRWEIVHEMKVGSGRPKSVRTQENIEDVSTRILSQEDQPGSHQTPAQISKATGISKTSVRRIVKHDLKLCQFKRRKGQRLSPAHELKLRRECCRA